MNDLGEVQRFHRRHKLVLLARSPTAYKKLGQIVANADGLPPKEVLNLYIPIFKAALTLPTSIPRQINVLQHALGYFKKQLSSEEKKTILTIFGDYREGRVPVEIPLSRLKGLIEKFSSEYLREQTFFSNERDDQASLFCLNQLIP